MCRVGKRCSLSKQQYDSQKLKQKIKYTQQKMTATSGEAEKRKYELRLEKQKEELNQLDKHETASTSATDQSIAIKSAEPITFTYGRNPESLTTNQSDQYFGQDVEPAGKYMVQTGEFDHNSRSDWEYGEQTFQAPLHLSWGNVNEGYEAADNWKNQLSAAYHGLTGKALSEAIKEDGYDGIITHDKYGTSEIIAL